MPVDQAVAIRVCELGLGKALFSSRSRPISDGDSFPLQSPEMV